VLGAVVLGAVVLGAVVLGAVVLGAVVLGAVVLGAVAPGLTALAVVELVPAVVARPVGPPGRGLTAPGLGVAGRAAELVEDGAVERGVVEGAG
jgi:hypothetical protein